MYRRQPSGLAYGTGTTARTASYQRTYFADSSLGCGFGFMALGSGM